MSNERRGWFADIDPEQHAGAYRWQPVLQADGVVPSFEMWFDTEAACLEWIREQVIGRGMIDDTRAEQEAWEAYRSAIMERRSRPGLAPSAPSWAGWHAGYLAACQRSDGGER